LIDIAEGSPSEGVGSRKSFEPSKVLLIIVERRLSSV
jgi:hypothetical protein